MQLSIWELSSNSTSTPQQVCLPTVAHPIRTPIRLSHFVFLLPCFLPPGSKITYRKPPRPNTADWKRLVLSVHKNIIDDSWWRMRVLRGRPITQNSVLVGKEALKEGWGLNENGIELLCWNGTMLCKVLSHNHVSSHCTVASGQCHCCRMTMVWETGP